MLLAAAWHGRVNSIHEGSNACRQRGEERLLDPRPRVIDIRGTPCRLGLVGLLQRLISAVARARTPRHRRRRRRRRRVFGSCRSGVIMGEEGVGGSSTAAGNAVGNGNQASASQRRPEKDPDLSEMLMAVDPTAASSRGSPERAAGDDHDDDERHQRVSSNDVRAIKQEMNRLLTAPSSVLPPKRATATRQPKKLVRPSMAGAYTRPLLSST